MRRSWQVFFLQVAGLMGLSLLTVYGTNEVIEYSNGVEMAPGPILILMGGGVLFAATVMSVVAGWKGWRTNPFLLAVAAVGVLVAQVGGILITLWAAIVYYAARSVREVVAGYLEAKEAAGRGNALSGQ